MTKTEITAADIEAVDCLIEMARAANEEGMPIQDRHDLWRQAFARHRLAAVQAERERCAALAGAILRASASNYAGENGSFALDNVAETIEEDLMDSP